jgi:hypothetical protein
MEALLIRGQIPLLRSIKVKGIDSQHFHRIIEDGACVPESIVSTSLA